MMVWWAEHSVTAPILLANKDNTAVLANKAATSDSLTPIEQRALDVSSRGGVKAASIAGAIFNHKDDKKGQQDVFRFWFEQAGISITFPDTSNTRYGSYCMAGAVLVQHKANFVQFLEFVRDKKDSSKFTNMEKNLYNALQDPATLTELSVLALYGQTISHPYVSEIRGHDLNMLNLGPLHTKVKDHIKKLIAEPSLLLNPASGSIPATLDGKPFENSEAVAAVLKLAPDLLHLSDILVAFLKGASETWDRFTSEFVPGDIIDEASDLEKNLAWMPRATNDLNEGALGSYQVFMRYKPRSTLQMHRLCTA